MKAINGVEEKTKPTIRTVLNGVILVKALIDYEVGSVH